MKFIRKTTTASVGLIVLAGLLAGCGGGSSGDSAKSGESQARVENPINVADASIVGSAAKVSGGITRKSGRDFVFPEIVSQDGSVSMTIPAGPLPAFPARRTVIQGAGQTVEFGDPVTLKYDMFAWSDGELVESSSLFDEAHIVRGGVSDDFPIPDYLAKSLLGRSLGDTIQVVLPVGTEDLPDYLDKNDAYVLLVELL